VSVGNRAAAGTAVVVARARVARLSAERRAQLAVLAGVTQPGTAVAVFCALVAARLAAVVERGASPAVAASAATTGVVCRTRLAVGDTLIDRTFTVDATQRTAIRAGRAGATRIRTDAGIGYATGVGVTRARATLATTLTGVAHGEAAHSGPVARAAGASAATGVAAIGAGRALTLTSAGGRSGGGSGTAVITAATSASGP